MRHVKWAVVMLGLAVVALGAGAVQGQQLSGEYKIGVLEPLTGNLAAEGKRHLEGYEIMRDLINERFGGVMGKKLVFVTGDAVDPTVAASEATRLATREGVKIITGTFSSTLCGAASEAASRQNVIYWETSCVDPRLTKRGLKNVFRTEIDGTGFGWYNIEFIAKHLAHRLGKKTSELRVAYLSEDSSYGQSVTESARQRAKQEFGMEEVALEYYTFTTNDLTPVILKLKNANPDVLHHIARNQDAILFWRQAREQNFQVKAVVHAGATGYGSPDFGKAFGNDGNGPFALLEPGPGLIVEKMRPEGQQIERAFRQAVKAKTGSDVPTGGHQLAGGGLWLLKLVLDDCTDDSYCAADVAGGDATAAYDELAGRLRDGPVTLDFVTSTGDVEQRELTLNDLELAMDYALTPSADRMFLQRAIAQASQGELQPLADLVYSALGQDPDSLAAVPDPTWSDAMYFSVDCSDYAYGSGSAEDRAAAYFAAGQDAGVGRDFAQHSGQGGDHLVVVPARQVGAPDRALEQNVANDRKPLVRIEKNDASGRVAGTVQHVQHKVADPHLVAFLEPAVGLHVAQAG